MPRLENRRQRCYNGLKAKRSVENEKYTYRYLHRKWSGKNHGGEIAELGQKAMIVTGRHSSAVNGSLDDVKAVLESQGIGYVIYNDIEENPSVETVYTAATAAVKYGVDMFVAVGGGSPMDASKAISMLAKNGIVCENAEFSESERCKS